MLAGRLKIGYKKYLSTLSQTDANTTVSTTNSTNIAHTHTNNNEDSNTTSIVNNTNSSSRNIGGRPIQKTQAHIDNMQECIISANHKITVLYKQAILKSRAKGHKKVQKGLYQKTHDSVKTKWNLPENFKFSYETAKKCISRKTQTDQYGVPLGRQSPLYEAEEMISDFIV
jgi:hypothetical protein